MLLLEVVQFKQGIRTVTEQSSARQDPKKNPAEKDMMT